MYCGRDTQRNKTSKEGSSRDRTEPEDLNFAALLLLVSCSSSFACPLRLTFFISSLLLSSPLFSLFSSFLLAVFVRITVGCSCTKPTSSNKQALLLFFPHFFFCLCCLSLFSSSSTSFSLSRIREDNSWMLVHQTDVIKQTGTPVWKEFSIKIQTLANGDHDR